MALIADRLAAVYFLPGLLYLDAERAEAEPPHPVLDAHDPLPARRGRLSFGGRGRNRL